MNKNKYLRIHPTIESRGLSAPTGCKAVRFLPAVFLTGKDVVYSITTLLAMVCLFAAIVFAEKKDYTLAGMFIILMVVMLMPAIGNV